MTQKTKILLLNQIETRRPSDTGWETLTLGGTNFYAKNEKALLETLDRLQSAIDIGLKLHFCLIRQVLRTVVAKHLQEDVPERIFGAVLGRALHVGAVMSIACLTANRKVLRVYLHPSRQEELSRNLQLLEHVLKSQTALSVLAAQTVCFPNREWGTRYMAQQLLGHLALNGKAVFMDKDLASWPRTIEDAVHKHRQ